jgi:hypothetical protein
MEPTMEGGRVARACSPLPKPGQVDTLWPDKDATEQSAQVLPALLIAMVLLIGLRPRDRVLQQQVPYQRE